MQGGAPLCLKLTPFFPGSPYQLPLMKGSGEPIVVHVTDSCGGNCPNAGMLEKGDCNGSLSPDCGNTAMFEGVIKKQTPPFKVYVGDDPLNPDATGQGYRCPDAWQCSLFGNKYWSPCGEGALKVSAPGFLDWCAGNFMHIDVNTEALMGPLTQLCKGVSFPGNEATCIVKYERVDCGVVVRPIRKFARSYSRWDATLGRNVWCCTQESYGTFDTCEQAGQGLKKCTEGGPEDCFESVCGGK